MSEFIGKLKKDLAILEAMSSEIRDYIMSDALFWRMEKGNMPRLTFGGYFLRQHKLVALRQELSGEEQERLRLAIDHFDRETMPWTVRVEEKLHEEARARVRQWSEYLRDLRESSLAAASFHTAVEARIMLSHLVDYLYSPNFIIEPGIESEINILDKRLSTIGEEGDFVLAKELERAYPKSRFWYLYREV